MLLRNFVAVLTLCLAPNWGECQSFSVGESFDSNGSLTVGYAVSVDFPYPKAEVGAILLEPSSLMNGSTPSSAMVSLNLSTANGVPRIALLSSIPPPSENRAVLVASSLSSAALGVYSTFVNYTHSISLSDLESIGVFNITKLSSSQPATITFVPAVPDVNPRLAAWSTTLPAGCSSFANYVAAPSGRDAFLVMLACDGSAQNNVSVGAVVLALQCTSAFCTSTASALPIPVSEPFAVGSPNFYSVAINGNPLAIYRGVLVATAMSTRPLNTKAVEPFLLVHIGRVVSTPTGAASTPSLSDLAFEDMGTFVASKAPTAPPLILLGGRVLCVLLPDELGLLLAPMPEPQLGSRSVLQPRNFTYLQIVDCSSLGTVDTAVNVLASISNGDIISVSCGASVFFYSCAPQGDEVSCLRLTQLPSYSHRTTLSDSVAVAVPVAILNRGVLALQRFQQISNGRDLSTMFVPQCGAGEQWVSTSTSQGCEPCPGGMWSPGSDLIAPCRLCPAGTYRPTGPSNGSLPGSLSDCLNCRSDAVCPAGSISPLANSEDAFVNCIYPSQNNVSPPNFELAFYAASFVYMGVTLVALLLIAGLLYLIESPKAFVPRTQWSKRQKMKAMFKSLNLFSTGGQRHLLGSVFSWAFVVSFVLCIVYVFVFSLGTSAMTVQSSTVPATQDLSVGSVVNHRAINITLSLDGYIGACSGTAFSRRISPGLYNTSLQVGLFSLVVVVDGLQLSEDGFVRVFMLESVHQDLPRCDILVEIPEGATLHSNCIISYLLNDFEFVGTRLQWAYETGRPLPFSAPGCPALPREDHTVTEMLKQRIGQRVSSVATSNGGVFDGYAEIFVKTTNLVAAYCTEGNAGSDFTSPTGVAASCSVVDERSIKRAVTFAVSARVVELEDLFSRSHTFSFTASISASPWITVQTWSNIAFEGSLITTSFITLLSLWTIYTFSHNVSGLISLRYHVWKYHRDLKRKARSTGGQLSCAKCGIIPSEVNGAAVQARDEVTCEKCSTDAAAVLPFLRVNPELRAQVDDLAGVRHTASMHDPVPAKHVHQTTSDVKPRKLPLFPPQRASPPDLGLRSIAGSAGELGDLAVSYDEKSPEGGLSSAMRVNSFNDSTGGAGALSPSPGGSTGKPLSPSPGGSTGKPKVSWNLGGGAATDSSQTHLQFVPSTFAQPNPTSSGRLDVPTGTGLSISGSMTDSHFDRLR